VIFVTLDNKWCWCYTIFMLKIQQRKRRCDTNQVIYVITNQVTGQQYVGITRLSFNGSVRKTLNRRMQKHLQRALTENKNWGLSRSLREYGPESHNYGMLSVVRGKKQAHAIETILIKEYQPQLNTFGVM
jgi:hypothetical protein